MTGPVAGASRGGRRAPGGLRGAEAGRGERGAGGGEDGTLALRVESVAAGGDGVARDADGRVVFVPRTAPGDRVQARVVEARARWARAVAVRRLRDGPDRVAPPCPVYAACGGCQLQHLGLAAQREARRRVVADALARIGGLDAEVPPLIAAGPPFGYRNRVTFTLRRGEADAVTAGYHRWDRPGELVDVTRCPLAEPAVQRAWRRLRSAWDAGAAHLPGGEELRLTLRASRDGAVALLVEGGEPRAPGSPAELAAAVPALVAYHWRPEASERRRLAGEEVLPERWAGLGVGLRPEAFVQVNRRVSDAVDRYLDRLLGPPSGRRLLDLYGGVGVRAVRWALAGGRARAIDAEADAVRSGRALARATGVRPDLVHARVEEALARWLPADVVVANPPRAGLSRPVRRRLAGDAASTLVYVSCDPATLARDLAALTAGGWRLLGVQPFDAFPQTAHVETVAWLERGTGSSAGASR